MTKKCGRFRATNDKQVTWVHLSISQYHSTITNAVSYSWSITIKPLSRCQSKSNYSHLRAFLPLTKIDIGFTARKLYVKMFKKCQTKGNNTHQFKNKSTELDEDLLVNIARPVVKLVAESNLILLQDLVLKSVGTLSQPRKEGHLTSTLSCEPTLYFTLNTL